MFGYAFDALVVLLLLALVASPFLPVLFNDQLPLWVRILDIVFAWLAVKWLQWWWAKSVVLGLTVGVIGCLVVIVFCIRYSIKLTKSNPQKPKGAFTAEDTAQ